MGTWWRSEEMTYVSLILSEEAAPACIRELGIMGCFQFTDLNPELTPFQRRYVAFIKRCDEIERKIRYVNLEVKKMHVPVQSAGSVEHFVETSQSNETASGAYLLESLESKLDVYEQQLLDLNKYSDKLTDEYSHKVSFILPFECLKFWRNNFVAFISFSELVMIMNLFIHHSFQSSEHIILVSGGVPPLIGESSEIPRSCHRD